MDQKIKTQRYPWLILLLLVALVLGGCGNQNTTEAEVPATETTAAPETATVVKNVLYNNPEGDGLFLVPGSQIGREEIGAIIFLDTLAGAPSDAWQMPQVGDGYVMAWTKPGKNGLLELYIAGEGGVWAPEDSTMLFMAYSSAESIDFGRAFHTEDVKNMWGMFQYCSEVKSLDLSGFDTSGVTDMAYLFAYCSNLESVNLSGLDTSRVEDMTAMFACGMYLEEIPGETWKALTFRQSKLKGLDLSSFNTSQVRSMNMMFPGPVEFRELDISNFNFSRAEDISSMFMGSNLEKVRVSQVFAGVGAAALGTPAGCTLEVADTYPAGYDPNVMGPVLARILAKNVMMPVVHNRTEPLWPLDLVPRSQIPRDRIISMEFYDSLERMPEDAWDMSRDQDGSVMAWVLPLDNGFYQLYIAGEGGVWAPDSCDYLFSDYRNMNLLKFNGAFHTETAESMDHMFNCCRKLRELDLSSFNTSGVRYMSAMFRGCEWLLDLDVTSFDTSNVYSFSMMFALGVIEGSSENPHGVLSWMKELDLTSFDFSGISPAANGAVGEIFTGTFLDKVYLSDELPTDDPWNMFDSVYREKTEPGPKQIAKEEALPNTLISQPGPVLRNSGMLAREDLRDIMLALGDTSAFGTPICRNSVTSLTFLDVLENAPEDAWDVSQGQDGSVLAWWKGSNGKYAMTIAAEGGVYAPGNSKTLFGCFTNLKTITWNGAFHTDRAENMEGMFYGCRSLKNMDLRGFDTSGVTDMSQMFRFCHELQSLDLSSFDTAKVRDMAEMFALGQGQYYDIEEDGEWVLQSNIFSKLKTLDISHFDTSSVENMDAMFYWCTALENLDVSGFDTSNVTNMRQMFDNCRAVKVLDVSGFRTGKVTDMNQMFSWCLQVETLDVRGFDTSNVTDMTYLFSGCAKVKTLDVSGFRTAKATDMQNMFANCRMVETLDLSSFDTSEVECMRYMFYYCESLKTLDLSSFHTTKVTDMASMFQECYGLEELNVSSFDTRAVEDMQNMFFYCTSLRVVDLRSFDFSNVKNLICFLTFGPAEIQVTHFDPSAAEESNHAVETLETINGVPTEQWLVEHTGG